MLKIFLLTIVIILPLTVLAYTVSGSTLIPTNKILSSIHLDPVRDIKNLYLLNGYPYVLISKKDSKITIVEEKLLNIDADSTIKNSILSILGSFPKILNFKDIQNISAFLSKLKISFSIINKKTFLTLIADRKIKSVYFNGKRIFTKNLYLFLKNKQRPGCQNTLSVKWINNNLYITSTIQLIDAKDPIHTYKIKYCKNDILREENLDLRNGWSFSKGFDSLLSNGNIVDYSITQSSIFLKYLYLKVSFNYFDLDNFVKLKLGFMIPYLGLAIDTNNNIDFYLNDYKNIFCGFFNGNFTFLLNANHITFGYMDAFYIGLRDKSQSYMIGYNFKTKAILFKIFDWRR